jgi:hypothetical protein
MCLLQLVHLTNFNYKCTELRPYLFVQLDHDSNAQLRKVKTIDYEAENTQYGILKQLASKGLGDEHRRHVGKKEEC